jgi:glycosyltransferase involved in cell wall biosynthesis
MEVAVVCDSFSMGGTAKVAATFIRHHDRSIVKPRAIALTDPGSRRPELESVGVQVVTARRDPASLARELRGVDIVHVHRSGMAEPLVPEACRAAGVKSVVETNVFGWRDTSADERQFSAHLLVSKMCALRYRERNDMDLQTFRARHRTLYNPVDIDVLRTAASSSDDARRVLGLDAARPTVVRVGRDDDRKWGDILVAMIPHVVRAVPDVQVVLVGTTKHRCAQLRRLGVLDAVRCVPTTDDGDRLAALYCAADVFVSASSIGESFGLAIAEAMALGVPVVTSSTPWTDNAQVELVDNGVNGWVARHPVEYAEAVVDLLHSEGRRRSFGMAAAKKAEETWHAVKLTRELERLYQAIENGETLPIDSSPSMSDEETFGAEYPCRLDETFRSLTASEERDAARMVRRERATWMLRDLQASPVRAGKILAGLALGRLKTARR